MVNKSRSNTEKLIVSSLFASLTFIGTQFIKIPLVVGYLNLGDCFVLLSGWIVGGVWAMLGSAIGAGLADLLSGYIIYAPITVFIKALIALVAYLGYKIIAKKRKVIMLTGYIVSGIIAELIMVIGYFLFEGFLYGFATAGIALIGNLVQGAIAVIVGVILVSILESTAVIKNR